MFFFLICGHFLGDYVLQTDMIAQFKNPNKNEEAKAKTGVPWFYWMLTHALVHGAIVAAILGSWQFGLAEATCHFIIDWLKCNKKINIHVDQLLHITCKLLWYALMLSTFLGMD